MTLLMAIARATASKKISFKKLCILQFTNGYSFYRDSKGIQRNGDQIFFIGEVQNPRTQLLPNPGLLNLCGQ